MRAHLSKAAPAVHKTEAPARPKRAPAEAAMSASGGRFAAEHQRGLPPSGDRTGYADGLRAAAQAISGVPLDDRRVQAHARPGGLLVPLVQRASPPVVQRSVLHMVDDEGNVTFYSDLETGRKGKGMTQFATKEEAEQFDEQLLGQKGVLEHALWAEKKPNRAPRERRVPTPYGYLHTATTAKIRQQMQGPHSLSFSSFEQRLQNRLRKGQYKEISDQVLTPGDAGAMMKKVYNVDDNDIHYKRYIHDYKSIYTEFKKLNEDPKTDFGVQTRFHLVARKLLQLHPYTTYSGGKSTNRGENRHAILSDTVIDSQAMGHFKDKPEYETYLQTRGDLYHSSDEEEEGYEPPKGSTPYKFSHVKARDRKYARKNRVVDNTVSNSNLNTTSTSVQGSGPDLSSISASKLSSPLPSAPKLSFDPTHPSSSPLSLVPFPLLPPPTPTQAPVLNPGQIFAPLSSTIAPNLNSISNSDSNPKKLGVSLPSKQPRSVSPPLVDSDEEDWSSDDESEPHSKYQHTED